MDNVRQKKIYMLPGDVNENRKGGMTWLHQVIADKKEIGWVEALLEHGAKVNALTDTGICPLLLAASVGNPDVVQVLIRHGADINCSSFKGWTSLRNAAAAGHSEVVRVLLRHGADQSMGGDDGQTPIMVAESNGHEAVVRLLRGREQPPAPEIAGGATKADPDKACQPNSGSPSAAQTAPPSIIVPARHAPPKKWWQFWK